MAPFETGQLTFRERLPDLGGASNARKNGKAGHFGLGTVGGCEALLVGWCDFWPALTRADLGKRGCSSSGQRLSRPLEASRYFTYHCRGRELKIAVQRGTREGLLDPRGYRLQRFSRLSTLVGGCSAVGLLRPASDSRSEDCLSGPGIKAIGDPEKRLGLLRPAPGSVGTRKEVS